LSILTVDRVDRVSKGSDRTLLGPIQDTAVNWSGFITKLWYCFVFENYTTIVGCSQTVVHSTLYSLVLMWVSSCPNWAGDNNR